MHISKVCLQASLASCRDRMALGLNSNFEDYCRMVITYLCGQIKNINFTPFSPTPYYNKNLRKEHIF